ncbi:MAG TPA: ClpXP protease specificity-enhancing factor SspB [Stellaceae bacterium]|nr:ClpXP protease specificity-enhancing factor SspB [Stellaceae bacterium]
MKDLFRYDKMVERALRGVVREALARTAASGLPGTHHFYITFQTKHPGTKLPESLSSQYPEDMTIVLEHQFWDLQIEEDHFAVTLSFQSRPERLVVPFEAITAFTDPSCKFGLQFQANENGTAAAGNAAAETPVKPAKADAKKEPATDKEPPKTGEVVALDAFRKK